MMTKYTASEIRARIAALGRIVQALHMKTTIEPEAVEKALREAQEALQTYHDFLIFRDRITDAMIKADQASENPIFCERAYKINFSTGEEESSNAD